MQPDVFANNGLKSVSGSGGQSHRDELSMAEISKDVSSSAVRGGAMEGSPFKNERRSTESLVKSIDEGKQGIGGSGNDSDEAEFSGGGGSGQEEPSTTLEGAGGEPSSGKGMGGSKKRKRSGQVDT